jgi:hypothetical protein
VVDSQAKGKRAEQALVRWLRENGWPDARRFVQTGTVRDADQGDIRLEGPRGVGSVVLEVKHYAGGLTDSQVLAFLHKLHEQQCRPGELGILIERRNAVAGPANWWAHLTVRTLVELLGSRCGVLAVVRVRVGELVPLLLAYQQRQAEMSGSMERLRAAARERRNPYLGTGADVTAIR